MGTEYSPKTFFKKTPNQLLIKYFASKNLLTEYDFSELPENKPDPILNAWKKLDDKTQTLTERDFIQIHELACETGIKAFLEAAKPNQQQLIEKFEPLESHQAKAFTVFLEHPEILKEAHAYFTVDQIGLGSWNDCKITPALPAKTDSQSIKDLASILGGYFKNEQHRGCGNCEIDVYRRGELDYFIVLPEDYAQAFLRWNNEIIDRAPLRPAFQIVFVYSQKDAKLSLHMKGFKKQIKQAVTNLFLKNIISTSATQVHQDEEVFDLSKMTQDNFNFQYSAISGIESAIIKKMRYLIKGTPDKVTIETSAGNNSQKIYMLRDKLLKSFSQSSLELNQVSITVTFTPEQNKKPKTRTFEITLPNSCSLRHDGKDALIRKMLTESNIEMESF